MKNSTDAVVLIVVSDESGKESLLGSGFIVSADGKVITNYHVIKDAHAAIAKTANGAYFLGSPLGLQNTVSDGIVSAIRQEKVGTTWIQTTTPVSPGNSRGPLLLNNGSVVGVITWGVRTGQNLNFAAPSNEARTLLSSPNQASRLSAKSRTNSLDTTPPLRLKDVRQVAIGSLGNTEAAGLVREKLINRLVASGKVAIVEDSAEADAVLSGAVGTDRRSASTNDAGAAKQSQSLAKKCAGLSPQVFGAVWPDGVRNVSIQVRRKILPATKKRLRHTT